jgi:hypothetical protein
MISISYFYQAISIYPIISWLFPVDRPVDRLAKTDITPLGKTGIVLQREYIPINTPPPAPITSRV